MAEHAPKSAKNHFNKLRQPTVGALGKGTKILKLLFLNQRPVLISQLPYLTRRWVLIKNQRALLKGENLLNWLEVDSGWNGWQRTLQNLLMMYIPKLDGWIQEQLGKEQKLS